MAMDGTLAVRSGRPAAMTLAGALTSLRVRLALAAARRAGIAARRAGSMRVVPAIRRSPAARCGVGAGLSLSALGACPT